MESNPFARFVDDKKGTNPPAETPETDKDTTKAKPADTLTGWGTRRRKLTDDEVEKLRRDYKFRRDLADAAESPEDWETVNDTLKGIAAESGGLVTPSALNRLVLGESYVNAPGPLDSARIARRAHNKELATRLGGDVARSMARATAHATPPAYVIIEVTRPNGVTREFTYPAGTQVTVHTHSGDMPERKTKDKAEGTDGTTRRG